MVEQIAILGSFPLPISRVCLWSRGRIFKGGNWTVIWGMSDSKLMQAELNDV